MSRDTAAAWRAAPPTAVHPSVRKGGEATSGLRAARVAAELASAYGFSDGTWLDYGAGIGRVARHLVDCREVAHVTLCDVNATFLVAAARVLLEQNTPPDRWDVGLPDDIAGQRFDVVYSLTVFIHQTPAEAARLLRFVRDAMHGDSLALLQIPVYSRTRIGQTWTDVTVYSRDDFEKLIGAAGLEAVEVFEHEHPFAFDNVGRYHSMPQVLRKI